ncbi:hypothetical protein Y1Q_0020345 [Alligator mississippiensis]|uniref:Uncharacterized protein n=1 Tax=Alligator mississippiensis TaxID=8496 RepID=A0A151N6B3_ALLMI|nr:hypothetical protein Y1Q_0020345 [Alligator mississippiensis]
MDKKNFCSKLGRLKWKQQKKNPAVQVHHRVAMGHQHDTAMEKANAILRKKSLPRRAADKSYGHDEGNAEKAERV